MSSINRNDVKEKLEEIEALTEIKKQFNKENFKKELTNEKAFDVFVITFLSFLVLGILFLIMLKSFFTIVFLKIIIVSVYKMS